MKALPKKRSTFLPNTSIPASPASPTPSKQAHKPLISICNDTANRGSGEDDHAVLPTLDCFRAPTLSDDSGVGCVPGPARRHCHALGHLLVGRISSPRGPVGLG